MAANANELNRFLASAKPSATYGVMDRVAARRAQGANVISLSAGEPDFDTPEHVREAGIAAIRNGHTRYTQVAGLRALRDAVADKFRRENGINTDWRQTIICNGGKQVIFNAIAVTLNEGDEVIIPAPYWVSYPEIVQLCGGKSIVVECGAQSGFKLTPALLAGAMTSRTRWLILNSPSNPTGAFASCEGLIGKVTRTGQRLLSDDDVVNGLLDDAGVATVHGSAFGLGPYIRIAYALDDAALQRACDAIGRFCASLSD